MNIFRRLRDAVAIISMLVAVAADPLQAERSFWVHATLPSNSWARSYWETVPLPPPTHAATKTEVRRAARLLAEKYHANTLYLLFHGEVDWVVAAPISRAWRAAAPPSVELVPTLLFRTYNSSEGIAPLGGSLTSSSALQRTSLCCCSLPRPRRSVCTRLLPAGCYMRSARCMRCAYSVRPFCASAVR